MKKIKITVVRKVCHRDLIERYENPIDHACDMREGQVFVANGWAAPRRALRKRVADDLALRHDSGARRDGPLRRLDVNPASAMISCNDGFRPVSFLIETLD